MSAVLTLATRDHEKQLDALVAAYHREAAISLTDEARQNGVFPLLDGIPHGVIYLIGPARAPIGYIVISFGWSLEFGGMDGFIDEIYIRPGVRKRGIASEVLQSLPRALSGAGLKALHIEIDRTAQTGQTLYRKAGFTPRGEQMLMTRSF